MAIVLFLALTVLVRAIRLQTDARKDTMRAEARRMLIRASAGDANEEDLAELANPSTFLDSVTGQLLTKIRGEAKDHLVAVLELKGTVKSTIRKTSVLGAVRRCRAGTFLGIVGSAEGFDALVKMLGDRNMEVRTVATRALGQLEDPAAVRPLLQGLDTQHRRLRFGSVLLALVKIGSSGCTDTRAVLSNGMDRGRGAAAEVLGLLGSVEAVPDLVEHLRSDSSLDVRIRCARALGRIGSPQGLNPLTDSLDGSCPQSLRLVACNALGQLGDQSVCARLGSLTSDSDFLVARAAARAAARLGTIGYLSLQKIIEDDSEGAAFALEALARVAVARAAITSPMLPAETTAALR